MNVNILIFSVCSRSYITSFGLFCKYAVLANMSRGDWLIYTTIVKRSTWIMCNILPSLRCIAVRFLPLPLHTPDSRYAHKQNADERQTHIGIRSGAKCPTHQQGRPATSFSDGQSAENEKFHPHLAIPQQAVDLLIAEQKSTLATRICSRRPRPGLCMTRTPSDGRMTKFQRPSVRNTLFNFRNAQFIKIVTQTVNLGVTIREYLYNFLTITAIIHDVFCHFFF